MNYWYIFRRMEVVFVFEVYIDYYRIVYVCSFVGMKKILF